MRSKWYDQYEVEAVINAKRALKGEDPSRDPSRRAVYYKNNTPLDLDRMKKDSNPSSQIYINIGPPSTDKPEFIQAADFQISMQSHLEYLLKNNKSLHSPMKKQAFIFQAHIGSNHWATYACNTDGEIMVINSMGGYESWDKAAINGFKAAFQKNNITSTQPINITPRENERFGQINGSDCGPITAAMSCEISGEQSFSSQATNLSRKMEEYCQTSNMLRENQQAIIEIDNNKPQNYPVHKDDKREKLSTERILSRLDEDNKKTVEVNPDTTMTNTQKSNDLKTAIREADIKRVEALIDSGINLRNKENDDAVFCAADIGDKNKQLEMIKLLVSKGGNVNYVREGNVSVLMKMIDGGAKEETIIYLLNNEADETLNVQRYRTSQTAFDKALAENKGQYSPELMQRLAQVVTAQDLKTAIHEGDIKRVEALINSGVNLKSKYYDDVIYHASYIGDKNKQLEMVKLLVSKGGNIDYVRGGNVTVLMQMLGVGNASEETIKYLLDHGAEKTLDVERYRNFKTAFEYALESKTQYSTQLLQRLANDDPAKIERISDDDDRDNQFCPK